jgi:hypothetical protein
MLGSRVLPTTQGCDAWTVLYSFPSEGPDWLVGPAGFVCAYRSRTSPECLWAPLVTPFQGLRHFTEQPRFSCRVLQEPVLLYRLYALAHRLVPTEHTVSASRRVTSCLSRTLLHLLVVLSTCACAKATLVEPTSRGT